MTVATNEQIVQRLVDASNTGDVDTLDELYADNFVSHLLVHSPLAPPGAEGVSDRQRAKAMLRMSRELAPTHTTIDEIVNAGEYVTVVTSSEGTTRDGRRLTGQAISLYRIAAGKIAESWVSGDRLGTFQQLGIVPETAELQHQAGMRP